MIIGNRVPHDYFLTKGRGESDNTVHAGSYHLALREAGIEMCNILTYSSILPADAVEYPRPERVEFVHGEVMETIMAVASCVYGEQATAGLIWGWLTDEAHTRHGGLVCEYNGNLNAAEAEAHLREMLEELYTNGYDHLDLTDVRVELETVVPQKMYGTAIVGLCFTSYRVTAREES